MGPWTGTQQKQSEKEVIQMKTAPRWTTEAAGSDGDDHPLRNATYVDKAWCQPAENRWVYLQAGHNPDARRRPHLPAPG